MMNLLLYGGAMKKLLALTLLFLVQGCASHVNLTPLAGNNQECIYRQGCPAIVSNKKNSVQLGPLDTSFEEGDRAKMAVSVLNNSTTSFNFSIDSITATANYEPLHIITYKEREDEIKSAQAWASFAAALGNAGKQISASANSYQTEYGTSTATAYNNYGGSAWGYGSHSTTTYNPAAAQEARDRANAEYKNEMRAIKAETNQKLSKVSSEYLKMNTIFPGKAFGGTFLFELPRLKDTERINFIVTVDGEIHNFEFLYNEIQK